MDETLEQPAEQVAEQPPKDCAYWAKLKSTPRWHLAAATALHKRQWVVGRELTEEEFDMGIKKARTLASK